MEIRDKISVASVMVTLFSVIASTTAALLALDARNTVNEVRNALDRVELRAKLLEAASRYLEGLDPKDNVFFEKCNIVGAYAKIEAEILDGTNGIPLISELQSAVLGANFQDDPNLLMCETQTRGSAELEGEGRIENEEDMRERSAGKLSNPAIVLASYKPMNCKMAFGSLTKISEYLSDGLGGSYQVAFSTTNYYTVTLNPSDQNDFNELLTYAKKQGSSPNVADDPILSAMAGAFPARTAGWKTLTSESECN